MNPLLGLLRWIRSHLKPVTLHDLMEMEKRMAKTMKEVEAQLADLLTSVSAVSDQLAKATTEITNEIQTLKDALANGTISDAAQASLDALTAKVDALKPVAQTLDDLNPDTPPPPPGT